MNLLYKLKTPNAQYNGVTEGVPFSKGIGQTDDKNIRNILVNDYKYEDITVYETVKDEEHTDELENLTVPQLKEKAKELDLTNYSDLPKDKLIEKIKNA